MDRKYTYFISDLHLGASYIPDKRAHERHVVEWLRSIAPTAKRLFLLGDVLDYWFEYKTVIPKGYTRFFGALAELADSGVEITWFKGNHDIWIFGYLQDELGIKVVDGPLTTEIDGKRFYMAHGDGTGKQPRLFSFIRWLFRNPVCQKLYSSIHPRWTIPFAHGWSSHSRTTAPESIIFDPEGDNLVAFARNHPGIDYFIFGHKHLMVDIPVGDDGARLIILGDWVKHTTYALFDGEDVSLHIAP